MPGENGPAIEVTNLVKTYGNQVRALNGLNITVEGGIVFALLGPNGAGKSTTIKILTTLSRPDSGAAKIAGIDVLSDPRRVRRTIGCVAQKSGVDRESTGRENLTLQGQLHGLRGLELRRRVDELLERVSLTHAAGRVARTYSGGMQRKLDIAMSLIHRPRVLFLDEPTTGLDPQARADLWREIARLTEEGLTVLLTTHYLEEADHLARYVAIVDEGRVVAEGTPEVLKAGLRGDAVEVIFADIVDADLVRDALTPIEGLRDLQVSGEVLHVRAPHGASAVPGILSTLESSSLRVASVKISRPSLDDVYLQHTGRTFQEAEQQSTT